MHWLVCNAWAAARSAGVQFAVRQAVASAWNWAEAQTHEASVLFRSSNDE